MADLEWLQAVASGFALLGGGAVAKEYGYLMHRPTRDRRKLDANLELLAKLPEGSEGRAKLEEAIDAQATEYASMLRGKQPWDWAGLTAVGFFVALAVVLWFFTGGSDHWWFVPARVLAVLCAVIAVAGLATEISGTSGKADPPPETDDAKAGR